MVQDYRVRILKDYEVAQTPIIQSEPYEVYKVTWDILTKWQTYKVALAYLLMKRCLRRIWRWAPMNEDRGDGRRWTKNMAMGADERRIWRWAPMNEDRGDGRRWTSDVAMGADDQRTRRWAPMNDGRGRWTWRCTPANRTTRQDANSQYLPPTPKHLDPNPK